MHEGHMTALHVAAAKVRQRLSGVQTKSVSGLGDLPGRLGRDDL